MTDIVVRCTRDAPHGAGTEFGPCPATYEIPQQEVDDVRRQAYVMKRINSTQGTAVIMWHGSPRWHFAGDLEHTYDHEGAVE